MKRITIISFIYIVFNLVIFSLFYIELKDKYLANNINYIKERVIRYVDYKFNLIYHEYSSKLSSPVASCQELIGERLSNGYFKLPQCISRLWTSGLSEDPLVISLNFYNRSNQLSWTLKKNGTALEDALKGTAPVTFPLYSWSSSLVFVRGRPYLSIIKELAKEDQVFGKLELVLDPWRVLLDSIKEGLGYDAALFFLRRPDGTPTQTGRHSLICKDRLLFKPDSKLDMRCPEQDRLTPIFISIFKNPQKGPIGGIVILEDLSGNKLTIPSWPVVAVIVSTLVVYGMLLVTLGLVVAKWKRQNREQSSLIDVLSDTIKQKEGNLRKRELELQREKDTKKILEANLSRHEDILKSIFNGIQDGLLSLNTKFEITSANESILHLFDVAPPIIGKKCYECFHGRLEPCSPCPTKMAIEQKNLQRIELEIQLEKGGSRWLNVYAYPIFDKKKNVTGVVEFIRDITDKKRMEFERSQLKKQLIQAQKLEAIGTLAGGIAHDFNNILMAVSGYVELIQLKCGQTQQELDRYFKLIDQSVEKASGLIKQLLIFSRDEPMNIKQIDLNRVLHNIMSMMDQLIGSKINVELHLSDRPQVILGNVKRLEQVFMNLAINARDAMPSGGLITLRTKEVILGPEDVRTIPGAAPGEYVKIEFEDTGEGMDEDTLSRIFEPFFTTKEVGKGTGLGLAIVYSIIKEHNGWIIAESERGRGTCFSIFIPKVRPDQQRTPNMPLSPTYFT